MKSMLTFILLFGIMLLITVCSEPNRPNEETIETNMITMTSLFHYSQFETRKPNPNQWYSGQFLLYVSKDTSNWGQPVADDLYRGRNNGNEGRYELTVTFDLDDTVYVKQAINMFNVGEFDVSWMVLLPEDFRRK